MWSKFPPTPPKFIRNASPRIGSNTLEIILWQSGSLLIDSLGTTTDTDFRYFLTHFTERRIALQRFDFYSFDIHFSSHYWCSHTAGCDSCSHTMGVFPLSYFKNHCCILKKTYAIARKEKEPYWRAMELQGVPLPKTEQQTLSWLPDASTAHGCGRRQRQAQPCKRSSDVTSDSWVLYDRWIFYFGSMYDTHSGSGWVESWVTSVELGQLAFPHTTRYQSHHFCMIFSTRTQVW